MNSFPLRLPYYYSLTFIWLGKNGWNGPAWSLCAEQAAYLTFPCLWLLGRTIGAWIAAGLAILLLCLDFAVFEYFGFQATGLASVARGLLGFGAGVFLYHLSRRATVPEWTVGCSIAAIGLIALTGSYKFAVFPAALLILALSYDGDGFITRLLKNVSAGATRHCFLLDLPASRSCTHYCDADDAQARPLPGPG